MARPNRQLHVQLDLNKKSFGLNKQTFERVVRRSVLSVIASGDQKQIQKAINVGIKAMNGYRGNQLLDLFSESGTLQRVNKSFRIEITGGTGNKKSFNQTQARFNARTFKKLQNAGILNARTTKNLKAGIQYKKTRKVSNININDYSEIVQIIQNMGGVAVALDKYLADVERLCKNAGITVDELIDAW